MVQRSADYSGAVYDRQGPAAVEIVRGNAAAKIPTTSLKDYSGTLLGSGATFLSDSMARRHEMTPMQLMISAGIATQRGLEVLQASGEEDTESVVQSSTIDISAPSAVLAWLDSPEPDQPT